MKKAKKNIYFPNIWILPSTQRSNLTAFVVEPTETVLNELSSFSSTVGRRCTVIRYNSKMWNAKRTKWIRQVHSHIRHFRVKKCKTAHIKNYLLLSLYSWEFELWKSLTWSNIISAKLMCKTLPLLFSNETNTRNVRTFWNSANVFFLSFSFVLISNLSNFRLHLFSHSRRCRHWLRVATTTFSSFSSSSFLSVVWSVGWRPRRR